MYDAEIAAAREAPLVAPSEAVKERIAERVRVAMSDAKQGIRVCAVCDMIVMKDESRIGRVCETFCQRLQERCSPAHHQPALPASLIAEYDCSSEHVAFRNVLLSKPAFEIARVEVGAAGVANLACVCGKQSHVGSIYNVPMAVCTPCASSLMRAVPVGETAIPPAMAIANGFAIGRLPAELRSRNVHEVAMVSPSIISGFAIRTLYFQ